MRFNGRLFLILWIAGMVGVLSFLLVDLNSMVRSLPIPSGTEIPEFTPALKVLSLVQPAVLLSIAVVIGMFLAPKVGLAAPFAESLANGGDKWAALRRQILPGIGGALIGSLAIILIGLSAKQTLPEEIVRRMGELGQFVPLITRVLYGGVTEELLLRWGVMTLLVWLAWRLFQKGGGEPKAAVFPGAIAVSAVLFAVGHLPIGYMLFPDQTLALTMFILFANSAFGLVAGYLYWKKGLESAMIAHAFAHLVLYAATAAGVYF